LSNNRKQEDSNMSQTQATQPEVANYITDIFGADSDDEQEAPSLPVTRVPPASFADNDDDDIALQDSDDEAPTQKPNRFKKGSTADDDDDDKIEDSDEDDADKSGKKTKTLKKKRKEGGNTSRSKDDGNKLKKRKQISSSSSSSSSSSKNPAATDEKEDEPERASGDEYDSGDEVQRTAEDDRFIDEDDDLAGVAGEYDNEEQVFDDERPDDYVSGKGKSKPGRGSSSDGGSRKSADPFSETLEAMKKPKAVLMSEAEKDKITERLLLRMHDAFVKDEALFKQGEPAVHKLQMLRTVQQMVAVKTLQHNLLEKDILGAFKDWIEPKRDTAKTLPSLTVRTAVYEMLTKLPCQTDHLKRTEGDKKPIGYTILALRKHKLETPENKRALKELMEKWCRPVFRKVGRN
jgi:TFIIS helical bundle-like domain